MADKFQLKAILSVVDKLTPTLKGVAKVAASVKKHLGAIGGAVTNVADRVGVPLGLITAAVGGASLMGVKNAVMHYTELGATLDDASKRMKLSASELQSLNYLALQSDVSVEGLQSSVAKLTLNIGQAASGKNKELAALLKKLNIDPKRVKSFADVLPQIADAFKRNESPMARARMGMTLFGKGYAELLPMLVDGADGIRQNAERWKEIGFAMSDVDLSAAAAFDDQLNDLRIAGQGLSVVIGRELVPVLAPVVESVIKWMVANREWLATEVSGAVQRFVEWAGRIDWAGLVDGAKSFASSISSMVDMVGGGRNALIGLALFVNAGAIVAIAQLASTVLVAAKALGVLFLGLNPIVIGATGVAVAAFLIIKYWDKVKAWFGDFFSWIGKKFSDLPGWIADVVRGLGEFVTGGGRPGAQGSGVARPSLVAQSRPAVGAVTVNFENAPPGLRVTQQESSSDMFLASNVGYRSFARN